MLFLPSTHAMVIVHTIPWEASVKRQVKNIGMATILLVSALLLSSASSVSVSAARLAFVADMSQLQIKDARGNIISDVYEGMELPNGSAIRTARTSAEVILEPNGTLINISENTSMSIDEFQQSASDTNALSLYAGNLRIVAARITGAHYGIRTPSTIAGVRGTDFVVSSTPGQADVIGVRDGQIELKSLRSGLITRVDRGQAFDSLTGTRPQSFDSVFGASAQQFFDGRLSFNRGNPRQVPHDGSYDSEFDFFDDENFFGDTESFFRDYPFRDEDRAFFDAWEDDEFFDDLFDEWTWDEEFFGEDWEDTFFEAGADYFEVYEQEFFEEEGDFFDDEDDFESDAFGSEAFGDDFDDFDDDYEDDFEDDEWSDDDFEDWGW